MNAPNTAFLVGFTYLDSAVDLGFMLPLLADQNEQRWYVQIARNPDGAVIAYEQIDKPGSFVRISDKVSVPIGMRQRHVFFDENGPHVGTVRQLTPILRSFLDSHPQRVGIALQITGMIGTLEERRSARLRVEGAINSRSGKVAARMFRQSALENRFLVGIERAWRLENQLERLRDIRRHFTIVESSAGQLLAKVTAVSDVEASALAGVLADLRVEFSSAQTTNKQPAGGNFGIHESINLSFDARLEPQPRNDRPVRGGRRQEERVALLLAAFIENPPSAIEHMGRYTRSALFETRARTLLQESYGPQRRRAAHALMFHPNENEQFLAGLLPRLWAICHPFNRGYLLFYLSQHLGQYRLIRSEILKRLQRSNPNMILDRFRDEIEATLSRHS